MPDPRAPFNRERKERAASRHGPGQLRKASCDDFGGHYHKQLWAHGFAIGAIVGGVVGAWVSGGFS